jgi:DNA-binding PadR family transcriptional regulator
MELSKTAYVILGMIKLGKRTGYEIKGLVDVSTRFFWAASYGQIYPELKRLEDAGLIDGTADDSDGRRRRAYDLTAAGEAALQEWLSSGASLVHELRHEGVLKFFFADALGPEEQLELLRNVREEHERLRDELRSICPGAEESSRERGIEYPLLTLEWGIALNEFNADWCARMERRIEEQLAAGAPPAAGTRG